jgi:hypothetical protein
MVGSLAAGYYYRKQLRGMDVHTKDADCLLSPRVAAVKAGVAITERLLDAGWTYHRTPEHPTVGTDSAPDNRLPAVRLSPPGPDWRWPIAEQGWQCPVHGGWEGCELQLPAQTEVFQRLDKSGRKASKVWTETGLCRPHRPIGER